MADYTKNTPGAPTSGLYAIGDTVTDSVGVRWLAVQAGFPYVPGAFWVAEYRNPATSAPTSVATAGNVTYTIAQLLTGIIVRDCAGASRSDVLPTAALVVAGLTNPQVGQVIETKIVNGSDAAEVLTIGAGTGGAFDTNQVAASRVLNQDVSKILKIRITNVAIPAYVAYL